MQMVMNRRKFVMLMGAAAAAVAVAEKTRVYAAAAQERWRIGHFVRPAGGQPVITSEETTGRQKCDLLPVAAKLSG